MNRLFWGLFFVLLDYYVTIGTARVEILPDMIGFYLLMKGMEELAEKSVCFDRGRHWAFGMLLLSGVLFGADLLNPGTYMRVWLWAAGLGTLAVTLGVTRSIIQGVRALSLETENLNNMWLVLTVLQVICSLLSWVPLVGRICAIVSVATALLFLMMFHRTIKKSAG